MNKIKAHAVFEILGRPKDYLSESLKTLVLRIGAEKGVKILEKTIHEPIDVKDAKDLYTSFAEVTLEFDSIDHLLAIAVAYMPANIEIIEPESMEISNYNLNNFMISLMQRMHNYDAIVKKAVMDRNILENKLREVAPHLFKKAESETTQKPIEAKKEKKPGKKSNKKSKKSK